MRSFLLVVTFLGSLAALASCYKDSDLPPCSPDAKWPDPCAAVSRDAGKDAR